MKSEILHIVYATDKGYLVPTIVAACSAAYWVSRADSIEIDILDCGLDDQDWMALVARIGQVREVKVVRYDVEMSQFDGYAIWNNSRGIYARLLLPNILRDVDWCVYCDGDTLFTDDPLKLVCYMDDRYALVGHADNDTRVQEKWFQAHDIEWDQGQYVCAGFIIENLAWFRKHNGVQRAFDFIAKYNPPLNDQDAYYYLCKGFVNRLENGWGVFGYMVTGDRWPGCIHYASRQPWKLIYMPRRGILDVERLWFVFAKKVCRLTAKDFGRDYNRVRHFALECVSLWFWIFFSFFGLIPAFKGRAAVFKSQSFGRRQIREYLWSGRR